MSVYCADRGVVTFGTLVSIGKRALSRVLVILVSTGYGIVRLVQLFFFYTLLLCIVV